MESFEGERLPGYNVHQSFYAQHQVEALNLANNILDEMSLFVRDKGETYVRNILGCFLFTGDDVYKKIKVLSGGEKSRVALAKTLLSEANFLLLDEPTNHLDMQSIQILMQALSQYNGTFITVSHDRYFLSEVANKIWYIENQDVKEYPGTYAEYEDWNKRRKPEPEIIVTAKSENATPQPKAESSNAAPDNKKKNEIKKLRNQLEQLEGNISTEEQHLKKLQESLANPEIFGDYNRMMVIEKDVKAQQKKIEVLQNEWESIILKIEELEHLE
jgi:ATP-binding cassette subfamily F protein 3